MLGLFALAACGGPQVQPDKSKNRVLLAKDFLGRRDLQTAEEEARKALELDPGNAEGHNVLGLIDFVRSLNNFRLLEIDDCLTGVDAEGLRAELYEDLRAADEHFRDALELSPEYAEATSNRGSVALQLEDYQRASELFEAALTNPHRLIDIGLTRANLGWALFKLGDHAGAAKELRQAMQFNPNMCVAKYRLARVYIAREEWNKALEQLRSVTDDRGCPMQEAHLYLSRTYRQLGNAEAASDAVTSCVALAPKSCLAAQCRTGL